MAHGVGREARRRAVVAVAALHAGHRDVGRGVQALRHGSVVAGRAVRVASGCGCSSPPAQLV